MDIREYFKNSKLNKARKCRKCKEKRTGSNVWYCEKCVKLLKIK